MNILNTAAVLAALGVSAVAQSQSFTEWRNPQVNQINRLEQHADYFALRS